MPLGCQTREPITLRFTLVDAATCEPLAGLPVDVWSASPTGAYSGVDNAVVVDGEPDTTGETFLRGRQIADAAGRIEFATLYPGWYPVTAPHFHFTAPFDDERSFTWQFFLDDGFSDEVYSTVEPYAQRGPHPVRVDSDGRSIDPSIVVVPTGPPAEPTIERVVAIDLEALTRRPDEYEV